MKLARNYIPALKFGAKIISDDLANAGILTFGNVYWVDYANGSDSNDGKTASTAFKTVAKAYATVTTNNNDVILLAANGSAHTLTSMLDVSKNRVHFFGLDMAGRRYGQRARISMGDSTVAADIAVVKVTGVGCTFHNIKFSSSSTVAASIYTVADGGEYTYFENCEFYKSTDLDQTAAAELLCNGDSSQYVHCTFGSLVDAISGAIRRGCVALTRETITGKVARDVSFVDCLFWRKAGNTANCMVSSTTATDVERMLLFENCVFMNAKLAAATPAQAIIGTATLTEGYVLVKDCVTNCTKFSTTTGVIIAGAVPTYATTGIAVAS